MNIEKLLNAIIDNQIICNFNGTSLFSGSAGNILFLYYYARYIDNDKAYDKLEEELSNLPNRLAYIKDETLCNGRAGIHWLFSFLYNKGLLHFDDKKILCDENDNHTKQSAMQLLSEGNFDYLHGSMGLAYYLLYNLKTPSDGSLFFEDYLKRLESLHVKSRFGMFIPNPIISNLGSSRDEINLGLAHGMPSVLRLLTECFKRDVSPEFSKRFALNIVDCILNCQNIDTAKSKSYFPPFMSISVDQDSIQSRLAWCYGDLGVGYSLYLAGVAFSDRYIKEFAVKILEFSTMHLQEDAVGIRDLGMCHGVAGVAHIYKKIWKSTELTIFKKTYDSWLDKLLIPAKNGHLNAYFQKFSPPQNQFVPDFSLLGGTAGIGLELIASLIDDTEWDYCFMLNE